MQVEHQDKIKLALTDRSVSVVAVHFCRIWYCFIADALYTISGVFGSVQKIFRIEQF